jgi:hypothetical protein
MKSLTISRVSERTSQAGKMAMPTPDPLLDRQVSLLVYLTSGAAIFGDSDVAARDPALRGIDCESLHLVARFSHNKRMEKIAAMFPKTLEILGHDGVATIVEFARNCPPKGTGRMENARQFYDFLSGGRRDKPRQPAHVQDVAALEFACATARARGTAQGSQAEKAQNSPRGWLRRSFGVVLLRCSYNLRPIFEDHSCNAAPLRRDTPLAIDFPPGAASPQIFELAPIGFDLLARMDDWTDPVMLGDAHELKELLRELAQHGLIDSRS